MWWVGLSILGCYKYSRFQYSSGGEEAGALAIE